MAEEAAKKVKRRKSFSLLFGSLSAAAGLLRDQDQDQNHNNTAFPFVSTTTPPTPTIPSPRPKSHSHTHSSPDHLLYRCKTTTTTTTQENNDGLPGPKLVRRRRGSRPVSSSSGSWLGIMGVKTRSGSFGDLQHSNGGGGGGGGRGGSEGIGIGISSGGGGLTMRRMNTTRDISRNRLSMMPVDHLNDHHGRRTDASWHHHGTSYNYNYSSNNNNKNSTTNHNGSLVSRTRSKSFQKSKRHSMFGSFRSLATSASALADDDNNNRDYSSRARSKESSGGEEDDLAMFMGLANGNGHSNRLSIGAAVVLHHGEVQTSAPMWRKKSQYLVLTDTHLVRFKNRSKAAETFPAIPLLWSRNTAAALTSNRLSVVSLASLQDGGGGGGSPMAGGGGGSSGECGNSIPLNRILAVHKLDDGRPFFSVEVCYMEDRSSKTSSLQIQLMDPLDAELWRSGIRDAATEARLADPVPFDAETVECISRVLDQERDYDPYSISMNRAVRRAPVKPGGRSSVDENIKLASTPCYVVVGVHKIHILPVTKVSNRASMASLNELDVGQSYGILSLAALYMQRGDDGMQLIFR